MSMSDVLTYNKEVLNYQSIGLCGHIECLHDASKPKFFYFIELINTVKQKMLPQPQRNPRGLVQSPLSSFMFYSQWTYILLWHYSPWTGRALFCPFCLKRYKNKHSLIHLIQKPFLHCITKWISEALYLKLSKIITGQIITCNFEQSHGFLKSAALSTPTDNAS